MQPRFTPMWEREIKDYYKPCTMSAESHLYASTFGRNGALRQTIRRNIDPHWPNILYVGLGRGEGATDYIEIAGLLDATFRNYRMTLLDNDGMAVEGAKTRRIIRRAGSDAIWQQYLADTGQTGASKEACVPQLYEIKRANGDIQFLDRDIVTGPFDMHEEFDINHCVDVLCFQTDEDVILLALQKLAYMTKPRGLVIVDDGINGLNGKSPRIRQKVEKWGQELHLKVENEINRLDGRYLLLRKQS